MLRIIVPDWTQPNEGHTEATLFTLINTKILY